MPHNLAHSGCTAGKGTLSQVAQFPSGLPATMMVVDPIPYNKYRFSS